MKKKSLSLRPLEAAFLTILLLLVPLKLSSQNKRTAQPSWRLAFSQDLQEPQSEEQRTAEAAQDPHSECWTSTSDKNVRVVQQSVTAGRLIHKVPPKYPKAARKAHIEGTVILCAEITKE